MCQRPPEPCMGLVTHPPPHRTKHRKTVHLGLILAAAFWGTYREALPTALVATAPAAVIVLQPQEHQCRENHLPARKVPQTGSHMYRGSLCLPGCEWSCVRDAGLSG